MLISALGFVLMKRWEAPVDKLTMVSWQLVIGGLFLLPVALFVEGPPPAIDAPAVGGFLWLGGVGTVLAYVCWYHGLSRMPAGAVSLIGLVNPVVGTLLGIVFAAELFGPTQALGMALVLGGVLAGQGWGARMASWFASGAARRQSSSPSVCSLPAAATTPREPSLAA